MEGHGEYVEGEIMDAGGMSLVPSGWGNSDGYLPPMLPPRDQRQLDRHEARAAWAIKTSEQLGLAADYAISRIRSRGVRRYAEALMEMMQIVESTSHEMVRQAVFQFARQEAQALALDLQQNHAALASGMRGLATRPIEFSDRRSLMDWLLNR